MIYFNFIKFVALALTVQAQNNIPLSITDKGISLNFALIATH